jgi:hypothetical protein
MNEITNPSSRDADADAATTDVSERESTAILVHGTFTGSSESMGDQWWQSGSQAVQKLQSRIPESIRFAKEHEVFHWSGENSERARIKTARRLLKQVREIEEQGKDCHLIGHSHGGSVIWSALQLSMLMKRPLKGLQSWTTIGTPFLQHRSRGAWNVMNWLGLFVGLVLLRPAFMAPMQLIKTLSKIVSGSKKGIVLDSDMEIGYTAIFRGPVLALIEMFGVAVTRLPDDTLQRGTDAELPVCIGSYDPGTGQSLAQYFFLTTEGLFLFLLTTLMAYLFVHVALLCFSPAFESYRIRVEHRMQRRAFQEYGSRWLGIWSPEDEAINGLRATLDLSVSFVGKMVPRERVFLSDSISLLSRPYYILAAPIFNRLFRPALDGTVRSVVIRAAQGNDRPTATLVDVTSSPIADLKELAPPLPELLNARLLAFTNSHAHALVQNLRKLLGQPSFTSGLETFGKHLSGNELVHTAYFEQEEVLSLIASNMMWDSTSGECLAEMPSMPPWLKKWLIANKQALAENCSPLRSH